MCRYGVTIYKTSWACLPCRHVAQFSRYETPRCPQCRADLVDLGYDFQAPRKRDSAGWAAVEIVVRTGKTYSGCGCGGPGYRPRTKAQARQSAYERPWRVRGAKL